MREQVRTTTFLLLWFLFAFASMFGYAIYARYYLPPDDSISATMNRLLVDDPIIAFLLGLLIGLLAGHWAWALRR